MPEPFRILISSAGRRVALLECFRSAAKSLQLELEIYACDADPDMSAACQKADHYFAAPRCDDPEFIEVMLEAVEQYGLNLIVPTIDPELRPYARAVERFRAKGARVLVSAADVIEIARNKLKTARVLAKSGVPVPKTSEVNNVIGHENTWSWPIFMKPVAGSASRGLQIIDNPENIPESFAEPMIFQEYLSGPEYTINMFIDQHGVLRAAVPHKRLRVRAGEVEKGRTERNSLLVDIAEKIATALPGARGVMCFQAIFDPTQGPRVIEINARFGGGYPLADFAGATFARWLLEEATGIQGTAHDNWREGVEMLRYDDAVFRG